ncbi:hypothetical protein FXO37_22117 [Capsicum annuum]|nr:hypothetical protein FXO37_22117 [Capsicum annuum]
MSSLSLHFSPTLLLPSPSPSPPSPPLNKLHRPIKISNSSLPSSLYSFRDLLHSKLSMNSSTKAELLLMTCKLSSVLIAMTADFSSPAEELFLSWCWGNKNLELVYRRDRSLGGREVLVAKNKITIDRKKPNVLDGDDVNSNWGWARRRKKKNPVEQLPKWWPVSSSGSDQEEYQRMANRLILSLQICFPAILDNRMTGRDILGMTLFKSEKSADIVCVYIIECHIMMDSMVVVFLIK